MSTVAYKDGVWAYDTRVSGGDYLDNAVDKAFETNVPSLSMGVVGDLTALTKLKYADFPHPNEEDDADPERYAYTKIGPFVAETLADLDAEVMFVINRRVFGTTDSGGVYEVARGWNAMGSGAGVALGVMYCQIPAIDAVEIASEFDVYTSNKVREIVL